MQQQQQQQQQPQAMLQQQQVRQTVQQLQQQQQQNQIPNIVTIQSGAAMTSQQLQQLQLKQQQMNQQQKYQQMNQQQQQPIQMQQQQMKSQPQQIQLISANSNTNQQFYQTNSTMQHQYNQQLTANSNMATSIPMTGASPMTPFQANSPQQPPTPQQQQQSNQSSPSPNLKLSTQHHQSTLSPINQNILLGNNSNIMTSPVKSEPTGHGGGHGIYQQNKTELKTTIKTEDHHQNRRPGMQAIENEFDNDITDVADLIGIDLAAEKKTLLASSTGKSSSLDQIRACKDEKFLNIMILHKKFVDIGKQMINQKYNIRKYFT
jgi:hypothetical protein